MMWWFSKRERDLDRELRAHLDLEAEERGDADTARRALGNVGLIKEEVRMSWGWVWFERLWQDLRYATRVLRKSRGFTAVAVLSLALGIGANTALFSLVDAVMLKTLPVRDPRQLRLVTWPQVKVASKQAIHSHSNGGTFSYPAYLLFRDHVSQLSDLIAYAGAQLTVSTQGTSEVAIGWFVSGNYFAGLGVQPLAGRLIVPDDDAPGQPPVAVLSHRYWMERFGGDPGVFGQEISINRTRATVTGVLPPSFHGLDSISETDIFVPMSQIPALGPSWYSLSDPYNWWVQVFGRLRPGESGAAAAEAIHAILAAHIQSFAGAGFYVPEIRVESGARGTSGLRDYGANRLYILDVIVGMVLLIACVNLANLLLARSAARRREIAVRLSIGASRARLIRQLLTESLLLAAAGGVAGLTVAKALADVFNLALFASTGYNIPEVYIDSRALVFTLTVVILTAALAGLLPAWRATRVDLGPSLKGSVSASSLSSRQYASRALIVAQVALSALLLVGAGLFVRTLTRLMNVDLGFNTSHLLLFQTDVTRSGYKGQKAADAYARIREKIESLPGVQSVGLSSTMLIHDGEMSSDFLMSSSSIRPGGSFHSNALECSDSFLSTMHIPVVLGRGLKQSDGPEAPRVAVVNEEFVKGYFPAGVNPIGQTFGRMPGVEIIGVVRDTHYDSIRDTPQPAAYFPYTQDPRNLERMTFAIRTTLPPLSLTQSVRRAVAEVDSSIPVDKLRTMDDQIGLSLSSERTTAELVSVFGLAAALLAAIGLYGVMAYTVARRTSEIGIRIALGANGRSVSWLVVRESMWMVVAGLVIGLPAALVLSRFVRSLLYGVTPNDPWSFTAAILLMAIAGAAAAWIPARRAARVDPMTALRNE